jgi:hypothetical protein
MRTTINLDNHLLAAAKRLAQDTGTTLTALRSKMHCASGWCGEPPAARRTTIFACPSSRVVAASSQASISTTPRLQDLMDGLN